jgi:hypothetical protein
MRYQLGNPKKKPQAQRHRRAFRREKHTYEQATLLPVYRQRRRVTADPTPPRTARGTVIADGAHAPSAARAVSFGRLVAQALLHRWWVLLVLAVLVSCVAFASSDERFFVYEAQIVGAAHLDAGSIYQAAAIDKQSIFWISPRRVEAQLTGLGGVKSVRVHCSLPASVVIQVEERQPILLWRLETLQQDWWLDDEGVVLPYHGDPNSDRTVFVRDYSGRPLKAGDRIQPDGLASSVLQMAASLPGARVFFYEADRGLSFTEQTTAGQWPVYVGTGNDLPRKIQVTEVLNEYLKTNGILPTYVDVRWASRPVYGLPASAGSAGGN